MYQTKDDACKLTDPQCSLERWRLSASRCAQPFSSVKVGCHAVRSLGKCSWGISRVLGTVLGPEIGQGTKQKTAVTQHKFPLWWGPTTGAQLRGRVRQ